MNKIEYWLNNKLLGIGFVKEASTSQDRITVAKELGIEYYDTFVFPRKKATLVSSDIKYMDKNDNLIVFDDFKSLAGKYKKFNHTTIINHNI